jgi:hypothetical protein
MSKVSVHPRNEQLLSELELFVVATEENLARFDRTPFGLRFAEDAWLDPLRTASAPFLDLLGRLDRATFGPEGMPMPRWVFFDGAELPGGIVGLGKRAESLSTSMREILGVQDGYAGVVPLSMFIAIPTYEQGQWMGHNLAAITAAVHDESLRGLGSVTKAVALRAFRTSRQLGATQWDSRAINVHIKLGPLDLLTAWTPAHSTPATLTYCATVTDETLLHLAGDPSVTLDFPEPDQWVFSDDEPAMRALQRRIESGERFVLAGRTERLKDGRQRVPVALV